MNQRLVDYGIQTDESDFNLRVSFGTRTAYVFPTESGRVVLEKNLYEKLYKSQPGVRVVTGVGYRVPHHHIDDCQEIAIPDDLLEVVNCTPSDMPSEKGRKAQIVGQALLRRGLVSFPTPTVEVTEKAAQIAGKDAVVHSDLSVQIKCDYWAGKRGIFLQVQECNPKKRY